MKHLPPILIIGGLFACIAGFFYGETHRYACVKRLLDTESDGDQIARSCDATIGHVQSAIHDRLNQPLSHEEAARLRKMQSELSGR